MDNYDWHDWIEQLARAIAASKLGEKGNNTKSRNERIINIVRERGNRSCNLITYIYMYICIDKLKYLLIPLIFPPLVFLSLSLITSFNSPRN